MSRILFILLIILFTMCNELKSSQNFLSTDKNYSFRISNCGITYKEEKLLFGSDIKIWEESLGPSSRKIKGYKADWGFLLWDSLGIELKFNQEEKAESVKLFFMSLDDEAAKKGYLTSARSFNYLLDKKSDYFVPYNYINSNVLIHNVPLKRGMGISSFQQQLIEKGEKGFTYHDESYLPDKKDPFEEDGVGGTYFDITDTKCEGTRYRIEIEMTAFQPKHGSKDEWQVAPEYLLFRPLTDYENSFFED